MSCARRAQPALPASQEAREDPGPWGGCSIPAPCAPPEERAEPRVPVWWNCPRALQDEENRMKAGGRGDALAAVAPVMQPIPLQAHSFPL